MSQRQQIVDRAVLKAVRRLVRRKKCYVPGEETTPLYVAYPEAVLFMTDNWETLTEGQLGPASIPSESTFYRILRRRGVKKQHRRRVVQRMENQPATASQLASVAKASRGW